jgi:hypothetical protein
VSHASHTSALNTAAAIRWFLYRFIFALLFREQVRLAELVDNAFDAGARLVVIEIDRDRLRLKVLDDGSGCLEIEVLASRTASTRPAASARTMRAPSPLRAAPRTSATTQMRTTMMRGMMRTRTTMMTTTVLTAFASAAARPSGWPRSVGSYMLVKVAKGGRVVSKPVSRVRRGAATQRHGVLELWPGVLSP